MIKKIKIVDTNGVVLYDENLFSLPIKEDSIIKKSTELFGDSEPCIIHRSFELKKLLFEVSDCIENMAQSGYGEMPICNLPENIIRILNLGKDNNRKYKLIIKY